MTRRRSSSTAPSDGDGTRTARKRSSRDSTANAGQAASARTETPAPKRLTRREQRARTKELAAAKREIERAQKNTRKTSLKSRAASDDDELWGKHAKRRLRRLRAKDVWGYIGFDLMFEDGTAQVEEGLFSQTLVFSDVSYQAASRDEQKRLFSLWSRVYSACGADSCLQLNVVNTPIPDSEAGAKTFFESPDERLDAYVDEYNRILNDKLKEGVSNLTRERYITYAVAAESYDKARKPLARIYAEMSEALGKLHCTARRLGGAERLALIASQLRPGKPFTFTYDDLLTSGLTAKDFVCPYTIDFKPDGMGDAFKMDGTWFQVLSFSSLGSQLEDSDLSRIIDLQIPLDISIHVQALEPGKAKDFVKRQLGWIDKDIVEYQQKAVRKGYNPDLLPQELAYSKNEAEQLLDDIQYRDQRLFMFAACAMTYADSYEQLQEQCAQLVRAGRTSSIFIDTLDRQQKHGLNSALPLASNHLMHFRYLETAQIAMLIPFATQEIADENGGYYGQNKLSGNLVICDRRKLPSPMGLIFGIPGSGKTFTTMREMFNNRLVNPHSEFIVVDPKDEYGVFVEAMGGTCVPLSPDSEAHLNLFDIYDGDAQASTSPAMFKAETLMALAAEVMGSGDNELKAEERTIVDRCVREVYSRFADSERPPTLRDFHMVLAEQKDPAAVRLVTAFEMYAVGSLSYFSHPTSVDLDRRIACFSFRALGEQMRLFAMIVVLDWVYNRMLRNFERGVTTYLYVDEIQELFSNETVMRYFDTFWSIGRSLNLVTTGITQTAGRVLAHERGRNLLANSGFVLLLRQSDQDRRLLAELMGLSKQEEGYIDGTVSPGEGLLIAGASRVPFRDDFPHGALFDLWNTRPQDIAKKKRARWQRIQEERLAGGRKGDGTA